MISSKLKNIFALSIPVFIVHGLEEYFTGFYRIDPLIQDVFGKFSLGLANTFIVFQIVFWLLLALGLFLVEKNILPRMISVIMGLIILFEFSHIYEAIVIGGYYPGLITALVFPIVAFFFWKELIKDIKG